MDADPARLANCAATLDRLGIPWERVPGVDGRALPAAEGARVYDTRANARRGRRPLVGPEIGCYLSHIAAWRRIAAGPAAGGAVFEDDFATDDSLGVVLDAIAAAVVERDHHGEPLAVRPRLGDALMWKNLTRKGEINEMTRHTSRPVTCRGAVKWGMNVWLHAQPEGSALLATVPGRRDRRGVC